MKKFKDILKQGEVQFDESQWILFKDKLDVHFPLSKQKSFWNLKNTLYLTSSFITISLSALFLFYKYDYESKNNKSSITKNEIIKNKKSEINNEINSKLHSTKVVNNDNNVATINHLEINKNQSRVLDENKKTITTNILKDKNPNIAAIHENTINSVENISNKSTENNKVYIPLNLEKQICIDRELVLNNKNLNELNVYFEEEFIFTVLPSKTFTYKFNKAGNYNIKYKDVIVERIEVIQEKNLYIESSSEVVYENGLPIIEIKCKDFQNEYFWKSSRGVIAEQKAQTQILCFQKGDYDITLNSKINSCFNTNKISFYVPEDYNLLAATAFIPSSSNIKNQTFMPEALKLRNVDFELIIFDSKDQHTVFTSKSSDNHWDGIDTKTGNLVPANVLYLWKVIIKNPAKGEKNEYNGTVIRL